MIMKMQEDSLKVMRTRMQIKSNRTHLLKMMKKKIQFHLKSQNTLILLFVSQALGKKKLKDASRTAQIAQVSSGHQMTKQRLIQMDACAMKMNMNLMKMEMKFLQNLIECNMTTGNKLQSSVSALKKNSAREKEIWTNTFPSEADIKIQNSKLSPGSPASPIQPSNVTEQRPAKRTRTAQITDILTFVQVSTITMKTLMKKKQWAEHVSQRIYVERNR